MGLLNKITKYIPTIKVVRPNRRGFIFDDEDDTSYVRTHGADYKTGSMDDYLRTYEVCSWVYICVRKNYNSVAQVPLKVWRRQGSTRKDWVDLNAEEPDHKLVKLLQHPNPFTTETELKQSLVGCLELTGNCYFELVGDIPEEMYLLLPQKVKIIPDRVNYIKGYVYEVGTSHIGFSPSEIMHFKYFATGDQYYGLSPIRAAEMGIITDINASQYNKNFFKNSAIPEGFLYTEQELSDAAFRRLK
jgi:HK97 family phage portal protein